MNSSPPPSSAAVYYDPYSKCIKYDPSAVGNGDGSITLSGVIVDNGDGNEEMPSFLRPGKLLMGEIVEIIDPIEEEKREQELRSARQPNYYGEVPDVGLAGGLLSRSFVEEIKDPRSNSNPAKIREALLQKQRQLQSAHSQQVQDLMAKQKKDWIWFHDNDLNETRLMQLLEIHRRETLELQSRQQVEQNELMDLAFDCMNLERPRIEPRVEDSGTQTDEPYPPPPVPAAASSSRTSPLPPRPGGRSNRSPSPAAANASPSLPDRISTDRQKADEIKAVMRDRKLSREERQRKLAEIKERYASHDHNKSSTAMAVGQLDKSTADQRRVELQAIMRDRSLGREEKQERMAEVQAKYAAMAERQSDRRATQDKIDRMKAQVAASKKRNERAEVAAEASDSDDDEDSAGGYNPREDELDRARDEFAPAENRFSTTEETDDRSASSRSASSQSARSAASQDSGASTRSSASYASNQSGPASDNQSGPGSDYDSGGDDDDEDGGDQGGGDTAANRWNRAAVKAATSNMVAKAVVVDDSTLSDASASDHEEEAADDSLRSARSTKSGRSGKAADESLRSGRSGKSADRSRRSARSRRSKKVKEDEDKVEDLSPTRDKGSRERASSNWNRAAVKAATSKMVANAAVDDSVRSSTTSAADMVFDNQIGRSATSAKSPVPEPESNQTSQSTIEKDPLEDIPTDRTPIKKLVKKLNDDDPSLTVLKLDGRKKIKEKDWESLFESLEENSTLTHLSMSRCEMQDEMAVALVLALVENETLVALRLNNNKGLTDDTAKGFIKVLRQSNKSLKKLEMARTKVTKKSTNELKKILEERDDQKQTAKMQEERQKKIKALLSFSAGDKVAKELGAEVMADDNDKEGGNLDESRRSGVDDMSASRTSSRRKTRRGSESMRASSRGPAGRRPGRRGSGVMGASTTGNRRSAAMRQSTVRASMTAQAMAQLGGDLANVGGDAAKLKEQRKLRGECEVCGQKCFAKTMFKTTPLTVPNLVYEGRCLKCNPL